ncbi:NADH-quinone oxidoreductase subunit C [Amycolatopsis sp. AA4]|uniref:NADH-quinone oxidoreductase subunit C n=1 Tax=Actinomycetes TaxID=1760 RepID=UPI0001B56F8C|nr:MULTISPECIES: NADH-quinone oxidoreductase subunit C [Actinomycetes]ATY09270.1 NADH-quinone oxidoreductase subunit C [Amycolatopsis sp. AA4]EFL04590.1 NADH-quinone oxidoreductase subunit C [Streptomyces sp. AA4]
MPENPEETPETGGPQSSAERPEAGLEAHGPGAAEPVVAGRERKGMFGVRGSGDTSGYGGLRLPAYSPPPAERPYGGWFDEFADEFMAALADNKIPPSAILQTTVDRGEITFYVSREHLVDIAKVLRNDPGLRFEMLMAVTGVDYGVDVPQRMHAVYDFLSMTYRRRIRLEITMDMDDLHVPSLVPVYATADWHEREAYDMFGIVFDGHPGLTRIFMPDDWDGHPQRKDYPLGGIPVEYKGAEIPPPDQRRSYS